MLQAAGFDRGSTVIMAGFPSSVTVDDCRSFASWFSPVIHVEELSSDSASKQFGVVFATTAHVEVSVYPCVPSLIPAATAEV